MHLRHATFQDQVKVLFFSGGQMKWVGGEKGLFGVPPSRFSPSPRCSEGFKVRNIWAEIACTRLDVSELEEMSSWLRFSGKGKELSPVWEIIQEHLVSSRCRDGMCEACGAKLQQLQGERTVTSPGAGDLRDNSCPAHLRRWLFRIGQNCAL